MRSLCHSRKRSKRIVGSLASHRQSSRGNGWSRRVAALSMLESAYQRQHKAAVDSFVLLPETGDKVKEQKTRVQQTSVDAALETFSSKASKSKMQLRHALAVQNFFRLNIQSYLVNQER